MSLLSDLVLNHVADLRQEVLANDTVEVAILWGGFVLDAFCQTEPLLLCITHQGPSASLTACTGKKGKNRHWTSDSSGTCKHKGRKKCCRDIKHKVSLPVVGGRSSNS